MRQKLEELGFNEDESEVLENLIKDSISAMENDALAKAKFSNLEEDQLETLSETFEQNGYTEWGKKIMDPSSTYSTLYHFHEQEVDQ